MNEIVADAIAAIGVIATGVNRPDVTGLQRDMMNLIELQQMVVSVEEDGAVWMIVDEIMRSAQANALEEHRRDIAFRPPALAREMAVLHEMTSGGQSLTVSAD